MEPRVIEKTGRPAARFGSAAGGPAPGAMEETLDWQQNRRETQSAEPAETKPANPSWLLLTVGAVAVGLAVGSVILLF